jgi:hypothetical protein
MESALFIMDFVALNIVTFAEYALVAAIILMSSSVRFTFGI